MTERPWGEALTWRDHPATKVMRAIVLLAFCFAVVVIVIATSFAAYVFAGAAGG